MKTPKPRRNSYETIWRLCQKIPKGKVASYGYLARLYGNPKATRAVARAMASNRNAPIVPCHRVVAKNGSLAGYSAPGGLKRKKELLVSEGIGFDSNNKVLKKFIIASTLIFLGFCQNLHSQSLERQSVIPMNETMEEMGDIERYFLGLRKKLKPGVDRAFQEKLMPQMRQNLSRWQYLKDGLLGHSYPKEKIDLWNSLVRQSLTQAEAMESALQIYDWNAFWLHFDKLLDIEEKAHKEFRPGLLKVIKKLFRRNK